MASAMGMGNGDPWFSAACVEICTFKIVHSGHAASTSARWTLHVHRPPRAGHSLAPDILPYNTVALLLALAVCELCVTPCVLLRVFSTEQCGHAALATYRMTSYLCPQVFSSRPRPGT